MTCQNCGTIGEGSYCSACGREMTRPHVGTSGMRCGRCGTLSSTAFCPVCNVAIGDSFAVVVRRGDGLTHQRQTHGVPALFSFFIPGLGQLVKGHVLKGILAFIVTGLSIALISVGIGVVTTPICWIAQIWDAYSDN